MDDPALTKFMYYDKEGKPIHSTIEWGKLFGDKNYQIIKQDYTPDKTYWISTVWLGLDHSFARPIEKINPRPLIFETMIFDKRPEKQKVTPFSDDRKFSPDIDMQRYCTESSALQGHEELLKKYTDIEKLSKSLAGGK